MNLNTTIPNLKLRRFFAVLALLAGAALPVQWTVAVTITDGLTVNGSPGLSVQWIDSAGFSRTAMMVKQGPQGPGYLYSLTYQTNSHSQALTGVGGSTGYPGDGFVQNHCGYGDPTTGQTDYDSLDQQVPGTTAVLLSGPTHAIIEFAMPTYSIHGETIPTTIDWVFADGRSHPIFALSQDARNISQATLSAGGLSADTRSPYGGLNYAGSDNALVGGASYGDTYKFVTLASSPEQVTTNSGWTETDPNTIPYAMSWADPAAVDAEMGHVATLPITVQDQGADPQDTSWLDPRGQASSSAMLGDGSWAFQILNFTLDAAGDPIPVESAKLAWGGNMGRLGGFDNYNYGGSALDPSQYSEHYDSTPLAVGAPGWDPAPMGIGPFSGSRTDGLLMAYSVFVVLGPHSGSYPAYFNGAVGQEVVQMENAAQATLSASVGVPAASGPAGVGGASSATIPYSPSGYNPTYAAWEIAAAGNAVNATLTPAPNQPLDHPIFLVDNYTSGQLPAAIYFGNGLAQAGADYFASLDSANNRLWITVNSWVTNALNLIVYNNSTAAPTITYLPVFGWDNHSIGINGENFVGATSVTFTGTDPGLMTTTPLSFTVNSPTQITAVIPSPLDGNGTITVTTPNGPVTSLSSIYLYLYWLGFPFPLYDWIDIASSFDGDKLVLLSSRGQIFTSANGGLTLATAAIPIENWTQVASSSDGNTLMAASSLATGVGANESGQIYLSSNAGATWRLSGAPTNLGWVSLAISTNGTKMVAVGTREIKGTDILNVIYSSTNSGATWTECPVGSTSWTQVASSADGTKLVAVSASGLVYSSTDTGATWAATSAPSQPWVSVASSADGTRLLAASGGVSPGQIYSSSNGGASWTLTSAPALSWINVSVSADGAQWAAVSTSPSTSLGTVYTAKNGSAWAPNNLPLGQWSTVTFTSGGNGLIALGGSQVYGAITTSISPAPTPTNLVAAAGSMAPAFTQSYTNTFPTGGLKTPFTGGSVASWVYWYGLNYNNTPMTNDPTMDAQGNTNSGSLKVNLPFGSSGDQGVFFGTFDNQSPYDGAVTLDASYVTSLAFDIHFAPGTPLDSSGDLGSITMSIFPGAENGGDFGLFPSVTIPASATNGWFHATEVITNFIAQEPLAGLTNCDAMGFNYNSYNGYPTAPVTFWIDNVSVVSVEPQIVPSVSWANPSPVVYGTALTSSQLDASASVPGTFVYSPPLGAVPGAGAGQILSATFTPADNLHYQSVTTNVFLKVTPASLTVTANNASRAFGAANPSFTASFSGFVNGDTASVVSGQPAFTTTATAASPVGSTYPIVPSLGGLGATNYTFASFVNGTLTVTPAVTPPSGLAWAPAFVPLYYWDALAASADGSKLFAAASGGEIYVSTNAGASWTPTSAPLGNWAALASSSDGTKLAAAASLDALGAGFSGAIYLSSDSGATWTLSSAPTNFGWFSLASATNGTKLAAVGTAGGSDAGVVYTSTNSGATWTSNSLPKETWAAIASSADGMKLVVAADPGQIFVSTNAGSSWLETSSPTNNWTAVASSANGTELVAAAGNGASGRQIYLSANGGATWTLSSAPAVVWDGVSSSPDGSQLIAFSRPLGGFPGAVYTSTNAGAAWSSNSLPNASWTALASPANGGELVVGNANGGIFVSPASLIPPAPVPAEVWVSNSVPAQEWMSVASSADGTKLAAVGMNPFSLLSVVETSTNTGAAWTNDAAPSGPYNLTAVASSADGSSLVAGSSGGPVFVSTNGGAAWIPTASPTLEWNSVASSSNGMNLVAAGFDALYTSADGGATWVSNNVPAVDWTSVGSSADGTKLVAVGMMTVGGGAQAGVVFTSANAGAGWTQAVAPNESWSAVASSSDGTKLAAGPNGGPIYVSQNSGASWTATGSLLYQWTSLAASADGNSLVAGSQNGQIFTSANAGASWTLTGAPVEPWVAVASSADGTKRVAVGTSGQIYTLQTSPAALLSIASPPAGQSALLGSPVTFGVTAGGTPPFTYQWLLGGQPILGATNAAFSLGSARLSDAGVYQVVVTGPGGSVTSSNAILTVFILPAISTQPVSQTGLAGGKATLTVEAGGTGPFTYQWRFNGTNLPGNLITTAAGDGSPVFSGNGGAATNAGLSAPSGVAADAFGNLFIADSINHRVEKVDLTGFLTTVAGNGAENYTGDGGPATNASLSDPSGVAVDSSGNLFIADTYNQVIRKVSVNGIITTVAGNGSPGYSGDNAPATNSGLSNPAGVALDPSGNLFIADGTNHRIRRVDTNGVITTVAGNGTPAFSGDGGSATNASLFLPSGVALDASGNLYIADQSNNRIRRVDTNGIITTVAGNGFSGYSGDGGPATNAGLGLPSGVAVDGSGNLLIADSHDERVRQVDSDGFISTVAGNGTPAFSGDGGAATNASLYNPAGVALDLSGNLFIADSDNNRIRKVVLTSDPVLFLDDLSAASAGNYEVIVASPYGSVTSLVAGVTVSMPQLKAALTPGSGLLLTFAGTPGSTYVLQAAASLAGPNPWQPLLTNTAAASGNVTFSDTNTLTPVRFYRLKLP